MHYTGVNKCKSDTWTSVPPEQICEVYLDKPSNKKTNIFAEVLMEFGDEERPSSYQSFKRKFNNFQVYDGNCFDVIIYSEISTEKSLSIFEITLYLLII